MGGISGGGGFLGGLSTGGLSTIAGNLGGGGGGGNFGGDVFNKIGGMVGTGTGFNPASPEVQQYKEYEANNINAQRVNVNKANTKFSEAEKINTEDLRKNINDQANQQKASSVNNFNAGVASQRNINPALAAMMMGNNLAQANTQASQQATNAGAQADFQGNSFNAQAQNQVNAFNAQAQNQNNMFNAQVQNQGNVFNAQARMQADIFNSQQGQAAHAMNQQSYYNSKGINTNIGESQANRTQQTIGGLLNAGGGALALLSDEEMKRKKKKLKSDDESIEEFLESLTPHKFKYKENEMGDDGGKQHIGVMAQKIAGTEAGEGIVKNNSEGAKELDLAQLTGSLAAGLGAIHKRLKALEQMKVA